MKIINGSNSLNLPNYFPYKNHKSLIKVVDLLGRKSKQIKNHLLYIYDNGTVEKNIFKLKNNEKNTNIYNNSLISLSHTTIVRIINYDDNEREYIIYVPQSYSIDISNPNFISLSWGLVMLMILRITRSILDQLQIHLDLF